MTIIRYVEHPAIAHQNAIIANLPRTTGRSLAEWLALIAATDGPAERKARAAWLKEVHGLGGGTATLIAERAEGGPAAGGGDDPEALVDALFAGPKSGLRPLADRLLAEAAALGGDVTATPCATILPIRRAHVFAQLRPATRTRLDLGLALGDVPLTGRLQDSGGLARKDRITRRIGISRRGRRGRRGARLATPRLRARRVTASAAPRARGVMETATAVIPQLT